MLAIVVILLAIIIFLTVRGQLLGETTSWLMPNQWLV